jgi:hypothetical protein
MEPRIKVFAQIGGITGGDKKCYIPSKDKLCMTYGFPILNHELSHVVEMRDLSRLTQIDFGMNIFGRARHTHAFYRPTDNGFFAGMAREIRVRSIERHINPDCSANMLTNRGWATHSARILPFGRFKTIQDLETWVLDVAEKTYKAWNKDRIVFEWTRRLDYLRDWMETK